MPSKYTDDDLLMIYLRGTLLLSNPFVTQLPAPTPTLSNYYSGDVKIQGDSISLDASDDVDVSAGSDLSVSVSDSVDVDAYSSIDMEAGDIKLSAFTSQTYRSSKSGDGDISLDASDDISAKADDDVKIVGDANVSDVKNMHTFVFVLACDH